MKGMLKLFKFLKPYKIALFFVFAMAFVQTLTDLYLPTLMADIIDKGVMDADTNYIMKIGGFMLIIALGGVICSLIVSYFSAKVSVGLGSILRDKVFKRVESYSLHEFDKLGTSTLVTRTTNDINQVQNVLVIMMRMMIWAPMTAIGGVIMAFSKDRNLTWVLAVAVPILAIVIFVIAVKVIPLFRLIQVKLDKINLVLREKLTGIRVVRAFNKEKNENERFDEASKDLRDNYIKINKIMAFAMPTIMLIMNATTLAILWFGSIRVDHKDMELGSLLAFSQYAMQIMFSALMMAMMFIMVPRAQAAAVRISEVLDIVPEIKDADNVNDLADMKGYLEFKNVTFSYDGAEEPALKNISFSAKPKEVTAIIGSTGSGKSTLINLIPRFYDIDSGSILVDGVDIKEMSQKSLRNKIGFVPQKAILFSGTIEDNIKFGKEDATPEEVQHAAKVAQAMDFIQEKQEGFKHVIAQDGANVSGGQKQRLSIARALVKRPEIYIFDDSFSALDFRTDARLREALKSETTEATVLIVAQRVGTVMDADNIIVMEDGEIVGTGKHKELLSKCEVYREIVSSQLSEEEIA